jgi:ribosome-associated protein
MTAKPKTTSTADPAPPPPRIRKSSAEARAFAIDAARLFADDKCDDIVVLDVSGLSQVTDFIVIGSGTSERQMRSALKDVEDMGSKRGFGVFRSSTDDRASWLLADFVDVVAHVFEPNVRAHYDLEMLWGDAPRLEWERPEGRNRDRAGLHAGRKSSK